MPKKGLHVLLSDRRLNKLRLLAVEKDKTITQIIEELIDTLPEPKTRSADSALRAASLTSTHYPVNPVD